jgi:hypothetical protein
MHQTRSYKVSTRSLLGTAVVVGAALLAAPGAVLGNIIWSGDYETGDFSQWHKTSNKEPNFSQMPQYCAPEIGDGSCLEITREVTRNGRYAAKFTVKTSANARGEPADCDNAGTNCARRRAELTGQLTQPDVYNSMPYMSERWISVSHYVPADWAPLSSNGWGSIVVFQIKPRNESGLSPNISINLASDHWKIEHRWSDAVNPTTRQVPWQQQMFYTHDYPRADGSDSGADLRGDFPEGATSQRALGSVNKGGWTDWVMHVKSDARGSRAGGTGFLTIWKREDSGPWIKVLDIRPKMISRGGMRFDRGIGYNSPRTATNNGGFGPKAGLYLSKHDVWNLPRNRVLYNDNIKIGSEKATFADMSPDGSTPGRAASPPRPPADLIVD